MRTFYEATIILKTGREVIGVDQIRDALLGAKDHPFSVLETIESPVDEATPFRALHILNIAQRYDCEECTALLLIIEPDVSAIDQRVTCGRMFFYLEGNDIRVGGVEDAVPLDYCVGFSQRSFSYRAAPKIQISILPREEMALKILAEN